MCALSGKKKNVYYEDTVPEDVSLRKEFIIQRAEVKPRSNHKPFCGVTWEFSALR